MENGKTAGDLLCLVGFMTICVGLAWAVQVVGFGNTSGVERIMWVLAAATVCGAGVGLVVTSSSLPDAEAAVAGY